MRTTGRGSRAAAPREEGRGPTRPVGAHSRRVCSTPSSRVRGGITETLSLAPTYLPWERGESSPVSVSGRLSFGGGGKFGHSQTDTETDTKTDRQTRRGGRARRGPRVSWAAPLTQGETESVSGQGGYLGPWIPSGAPEPPPPFVLPFSAEAAAGRRPEGWTRGPSDGPASREASRAPCAPVPPAHLKPLEELACPALGGSRELGEAGPGPDPAPRPVQAPPLPARVARVRTKEAGSPAGPRAVRRGARWRGRRPRPLRPAARHQRRPAWGGPPAQT